MPGTAVWVCNSSAGQGWRQEDSGGLLSSQCSWNSELQVSWETDPVLKHLKVEDQRDETAQQVKAATKPDDNGEW